MTTAGLTASHSLRSTALAEPPWFRTFRETLEGRLSAIEGRLANIEEKVTLLAEGASDPRFMVRRFH